MTTRQYTVNFTKKQGELYNAFLDTSLIEILFGGGGRGGKTWGIVEIILLTCVSQPGIAWGIGRNEWDDLRKSTLVTLIKVLNTHGFKAPQDYTLNLQTKELHFGNGSRIFFIPLKQQPTDTEFNFLGGYELTNVFIDEAQEVSRKAVDILKTRLTEKIAQYNLVGKIIMGCNPMKGHLYNDFIKATKDGSIADDRIFIQALYSDNPHIDHDKYRANYANADKVTKERLLFGNWDYDETPGRLFDYDAILRMKTNDAYYGYRYMTCDPARGGRDTTIITVWSGLVIEQVYMEHKSDLRELKFRLRQIAINQGVELKNIIIDENGLGGGLIDELGCQGFINNAKPIEPKVIRQPTSHLKKPNYEHLKTQCYHLLSNLVNEGMIKYAGPDSFYTKLCEELDVICQIDMDKDSKFKLIKKDSIKDKLGRSPDVADAVMMRMFYEIRRPVDLSDVSSFEGYIEEHAYEYQNRVIEEDVILHPY